MIEEIWLWLRIKLVTLSRARDAHKTLRDLRRRQANRVEKFAHGDPAELKRAADLRSEADYHDREDRILLEEQARAMYQEKTHMPETKMLHHERPMEEPPDDEDDEDDELEDGETEEDEDDNEEE